MSERTLPSGRPSICEWELSARFKLKEQAVNAVTLIMAKSIDFPIGLDADEEDGRTVYDVTVGPMVWADNLKIIAEIFQLCDYSSET